MPVAVLEAMSYGLPIVATAVGALPELVGEGREGFLVPPRRPDLLAAAMARLATHAETRRFMGRDARQRAETRFSIQRFERDLTCLYDDLSRQAASPAAPPRPLHRRLVTA
jgi:glycosyltransferase involved in cell wall biosynthesis